MNEKSITSEAASTGDAEAIRFFKQSITGGKHWFIALLESIGLWASIEEVRDGRTYCYLIDGEAFDWLLLAERLCETAENLLPEDERNALIFCGRPPLLLSVNEVRGFISDSKYHQYLNFFYGVTVEEALLLAVQEEVDKERRVRGYVVKHDSSDEAYLRIYNATREAVLKQFRQEKGYPQLDSTTINELKEFTYWLFKYRLKHCEKAKIASDTKKALRYLKRQWHQKGVFGVLSAEDAPADEARS